MVADVHDFVCNGADEVLVVRDEHDGARKLHEGALEDVDGVDVQVVGGLVQEQQRVGRDEHLGQSQTRPLAAGEHAHALVHVVAVEEEGAQQATLLGGGPGGCRGVHLLHHGVGLVELLELVLGVVGLRDVLAEADRARVRR